MLPADPSASLPLSTPIDFPQTTHPLVQNADAVSPGRAVIPSLFIAVFAFLLASFPARNADIWGHLAAGRDLAHGKVPAAVTAWAPDRTPGQGWAFDLASYAIYSTAGGVGLLLVKSLLIAGLGLIVLRLSRTGPGWLIPAFCTGLALLAMGPRLLLQPATVSYFFLGLTYWLLRTRDGREDGPSWVPPWSLLALFLIWGNTDRWFLLGLVLVATFWLGCVLDRPAGGRIRVLRRRAISLVILMVICLLNPAHVIGLLPPPELTAAGPMLGGSKGVTSPFDSNYLNAVAQSPAGLAYFPLLGLSLLSFALVWRGWRWERFLPWAALAVVSGFQVRTVPFFAVVAGPVLALNLQDFFAQRRARSEPVGLAKSWRVRIVLRGAVGLIGLAFLACGWIGWLQAPPFEPRRWGIETPPALQRSANAMCVWKADGRLPADAVLLHLAPDTASSFAWFCPELRAVRDPASIAWFRGERDAPTDWANRMRSARVTHLVVYDTDRARLFATLDRLLADPRQWPLLHLEGRVTVFGWRDPARIDSLDSISDGEANLDRLALRPRSEAKAPAAPSSTSRRWWEAFWKTVPAPSGDRDEAAVRLLQAEALRHSAQPRHLAAWEATQVAGLIGSLGGWSGAAGTLLDTDVRLVFFQPPLTESGESSHPLGRLAQAYHPVFVSARDNSPAAVLYLAIRAARRALALDPRDAQAYASLGEAYLRLLHNSRERAWGQPLAELVQLRRAQAAAALNRAVTLDPAFAFAHQQLGALYQETGFLDLALNHTRGYLAGVRKAGPASLRPEEHRQLLAEAEKLLALQTDAVEERKQVFDREASGLRVLDRAILARDLGLGGQARDILLASDISAFGASGLALELELLVRTGRTQEVRDWTSEEHQGALGPTYHWLRVRALAASGEYALAQAECTDLAAGGESSSGSDPRVVAAALVGQAILDGRRPIDHPGALAWEAFSQFGFRRTLSQLVVIMRREADAIALRGLLALEAGDTERAAADFRTALATWRGMNAAADGSGIDFNARLMCQGALAWIESVDPESAR